MTTPLSTLELQLAELTLHRVALLNRVPLEEVRRSITVAITAGRENPDPEVRARWAEAPFGDRMPTPEEFVAWCARMVATND